MDVYLIKDFLLSYSLPTVIIAGVVALVNLVMHLIFKEKLPVFIKNYLPFVLSVVSYIAFEMIKLKQFILSADAIYAGVLCGSLSTVIVSALKRISKGQGVGLSASVLLIENLLKGLISDENLSATAQSMDNFIAQNRAGDNDLILGLFNILKDDNTHNLTDEQITKVVTVILKTVLALKIK